MDAWLSAHPQVVHDCVSAIGESSPDVGPSNADIREFRLLIVDQLKSISGVSTGDPSSLDPDVHDCELCGPLLEFWATVAQDPDTEAATWPRIGAPAGIIEHPADPGIFPLVEDDTTPPEELDVGDLHTRASYASVEGDADAQEELDRLVAAKFLYKCKDLHDCERRVGGKPSTEDGC